MTEIVKTNGRVTSTQADAREVSVEVPWLNGRAHNSGEHVIVLGPQLTSVSTFGGLSVTVFDQTSRVILGSGMVLSESSVLVSSIRSWPLTRWTVLADATVPRLRSRSDQRKPRSSPRRNPWVATRT